MIRILMEKNRMERFFFRFRPGDKVRLSGGGKAKIIKGVGRGMYSIEMLDVWGEGTGKYDTVNVRGLIHDEE
jgi:hypothetical protein